MCFPFWFPYLPRVDSFCGVCSLRIGTMMAVVFQLGIHFSLLLLPAFSKDNLWYLWIFGNILPVIGAVGVITEKSDLLLLFMSSQNFWFWILLISSIKFSFDVISISTDIIPMPKDMIICCTGIIQWMTAALVSSLATASTYYFLVVVNSYFEKIQRKVHKEIEEEISLKLFNQKSFNTYV